MSDLPPANVEAEQNVLGSMLRDVDTINDVAELLTPADFWRDSHQVMAAAVFDLWARSVTPDAMAVMDELERRGELARCGGLDYLTEVCQSIPHTANARYHAGIVREKALARRLIAAAEAMLRDAYSRNFTADELLATAESAVSDISRAAVRDESVSLSAASAGAIDMARDRAAGVVCGVPTGLLDLDDVIGSLQPRKLYVLAARPSIGKSALALNIADNVAGGTGKRVLFVSLEMDRYELAGRYLIARAHVDGYNFQHAGSLSERDWDQLADACDDAARTPVTIDDPGHLTITQLSARARRHKARHGLDLLIVDYLQLIDGEARRGEIREQEVGRVSRRLKGLAKELHAPVLALCQLNRAVESREDRKPRLSDLRESGTIEQDADVVMLLHRPDAYDPADEPGVAKVIVSKHRGGRVGTVQLTFNRKEQRFETLLPDF